MGGLVTYPSTDHSLCVSTLEKNRNQIFWHGKTIDLFIILMKKFDCKIWKRSFWAAIKIVSKPSRPYVGKISYH